MGICSSFRGMSFLFKGENKMKYGLLGSNLENNFSKDIAEQFGLTDFKEKELSENRFVDFLEGKNYEAISITFPYKKMALNHVDYVSDLAKEIGAVDTVIVKDGATYGYNTDYKGFEYMMERHKISLEGKKVLIIGNGGTAQSVKMIAKKMKAREINVVDIKKSLGAISYTECYAKHLDSQIVINTSPVGMSPKIEETPIDMSLFDQCEAVIDVIFNPILTRFGLDAQENNMKRIIGIEMLVAQMKATVELITGQTISNELLDEVIHNTLIKNCNVVLIGMPSSGKTTIGMMLSEKLNKEFIDMDHVIVNDTKMSVPDIFSHSGEKGFRKLETLTALKLSTLNNVIIGTGGGTIKNKINMDYLRLNGIIFFIDRDLENLVTEDPNRPLSSSAAAVAKLYDERYPIYQKYATAIIPNNDDIEDTVEEIIRAYHKIAKHAVSEEEYTINK